MRHPLRSHPRNSPQSIFVVGAPSVEGPPFITQRRCPAPLRRAARPSESSSFFWPLRFRPSNFPFPRQSFFPSEKPSRRSWVLTSLDPRAALPPPSAPRQIPVLAAEKPPDAPPAFLNVTEDKSAFFYRPSATTTRLLVSGRHASWNRSSLFQIVGLCVCLPVCLSVGRSCDQSVGWSTGRLVGWSVGQLAFTASCRGAS